MPLLCYVCSLSDAPTFPSANPSPADPFAPSTFGSTTTDGVRSSAATSNGQANIFAPSPAAAGRGPSANPFGPSAMNGGGGGFGGSAFAQPAAAAGDGFGSSASFQPAPSGAPSYLMATQYRSFLCFCDKLERCCLLHFRIYSACTNAAGLRCRVGGPG